PARDAKEIQSHGGVLVDMHAADPWVRRLHVDPQFLVQLALERALGGLAGLDLAAGKLPPAGVDLAGRALREQETAVRPLDDRSGNVDDHLLLFRVLAGPVSRELVGDAAAARAALQRPLQRFLPRLLYFLLAAGKGIQPVGDDFEILVLVERVERHPEAKALRQ